MDAIDTNDQVATLTRRATEQREAEALPLAWARVLERVVHLITGDPTTRVQWGNRANAPAWTDGRHIFLSTRLLAGNGQWSLAKHDKVVSIKGLVYHELGHVLYSPRNADPLRLAFYDINHIGNRSAAQVHTVWNVLEDGRMETLFTQRFRRAGGYFKQLVLQWLVDTGNDPTPQREAVTAVLIIGRRYLPRRLRTAWERRLVAAVGQDDATKLLASVRSFHATPNEDWQGQLRAILTVHDILTSHGQDTDPGDGPIGDGDHRTQRDGEADDEAESSEWEPDEDDDAEGDDGADADDDFDDDDEAGPQGDPCPNGDPGEGEGDDGTGNGGDVEAEADDGESGGESATDDVETVDGEHGESDDDGEGETGRTGNAAGNGDDAPTQDPKADAEDAAREALDDTYDEIVDDARTTEEAVANELRNHNGAGGSSDEVDSEPLAPTAEANLAKVRIGQALSQLRTDVAPVTRKRQRSGRLDVRRWYDPQRKSHELDVFVRKARGEGLNTELVILLDLSISMDSIIDTAASAVWALAVAAEREGITVTVVTFSSGANWHLWKGPNDRWSDGTIPVPRIGGGTEPSLPLAFSVDYLLNDSRSDRRLLVSITDGNWSRTQEDTYRALHAKAHADGVESLIVGIARADVIGNGHGAGTEVNAPTILDVPLIIQRWVEQLIRS